MNNEESKVTINTKPIEYYISQIVSEPQLVEQKMPMCVVHESTKEALAVDIIRREYVNSIDDLITLFVKTRNNDELCSFLTGKGR